MHSRQAGLTACGVRVWIDRYCPFDIVLERATAEVSAYAGEYARALPSCTSSLQTDSFSSYKDLHDVLEHFRCLQRGAGL